MTLTSKKGFQNSLRALIVAGSIGGFLGGWVLLAHSGKPVSAASDPANATLPPLNLQALAPSNSSPSAFQPLQSLPSTPSTAFSMPRFRTRGS